MLPSDAELTMVTTRIYTIRVNAEILSALLISLAQKHVSQNCVSRFSCKGCTILTIREKKHMTGTNSPCTCIGSRETAFLHFCTNDFLRTPPLISLGEIVFLLVSVFQTAKNAANIES